MRAKFLSPHAAAAAAASFSLSSLLQDGRTPLKLAEERRHQGVALVLQQRGGRTQV